MTPTLAVPRRTRGKLAGALLSGVAAATLVIGALSTVAYAEENARIDEAIFDVTPTPFAAIVKVISNNGTSWNSIQPTEIAFDARIKIDTKGNGYIEQYAVFLGACSNPSCGSHPKVLHEIVQARDMDRSGTIRFSSSLLHGVDSGMGNSYITAIINRCNQKPVTEAHGFRRPVDASLSANTRKAAAISNFDPVEAFSPFAGGDVNRTDQFEIQVECVPVVKTSKSESKPEPHRTPPKVVDGIDLFLSTFKVTETGPSGTTCKPLKVTTRIETGAAGPKNVKLWRQVNGGAITSETKAMNAEAIGGGKFGDDWNKMEHFTQTTTVQYKAEMLGGTFAPSTPWKSITIHCNGDYAPTSGTSNPDGIPPRGRPQVELPPTIVTPPPMCGTKAAKVRGSAPCIKTAPVPDQRQAWADQKRNQADEKRRAAREADLRRREAAVKDAEQAQRQPMVQRPVGFGFGRFMGPARPMGPAAPNGARPGLRPGFVMTPGLILR